MAGPGVLVPSAFGVLDFAFMVVASGRISGVGLCRLCDDRCVLTTLGLLRFGRPVAGGSASIANYGQWWCTGCDLHIELSADLVVATPCREADWNQTDSARVRPSSPRSHPAPLLNRAFGV